MPIKIYNTLTRRKEGLKPIRESRINMFVCGPTVWEHSHLGHARTYIAFDTIARHLRHQGYALFYIMNITDVDDHIINRAKETGRKETEIATEYEESFHQDMKALGMTSVNLYAKASHHIPEIIDQIQRLIAKGYAYETPTGVYYDITMFKDFGKLSHQKIEELKKHRIEPDPTKRHPQDFALWKKKETGLRWDSPWGPGRPGWHIEDTAITETYLGQQYDIHGGGIDLIFPHHESEIVQMESISGKKPMVKYWLHTGFLMVGGEKMAKSLGNFVTIKDILKTYHPEDLRYYFASTHYRSPIDYSEKDLQQAHNSLDTLYNAFDNLKQLPTRESKTLTKEERKLRGEVQKARKNFLEAMDDDFNTPLAISHFFDMAKKTNVFAAEETEINKNLLKETMDIFKELGDILGILEREKALVEEALIRKLMELIIELRGEFRERGEFAISDRIRATLRKWDIILEDTPEGIRLRER